MRSRLFTSLVVSFAVLLACEPSRPRAQETSPAPDLRVATYNVQWFSESANPERIANLKAVVRGVDAHVWGLQEIQSLSALRQVFGDEWQVGMVDDPDEQQELAVAVRRPYELVEHKMVFPDESLDAAFPGRRDVLRAVIKRPDGFQASVYVVHMKSRVGGRLQTDIRRREAQGLLAAYLMGRAEEHVVVMGDMNDAPDDQSVNILETRNLMAQGGRDDAKRYLVNLAEPLYDRDYVSYGLDRLFQGEALRPVVEGAKADNERLRGIEYEFPRDVRVIQIMFDQILVSPALNAKFQRADVFARPEALRGERGRTTITDDRQVVYEFKGSQASDHLPVIAEFRVAR